MQHDELVRQVLETEARALSRVAGLVQPKEVQKMIDLFNWLIQTGGSLVTSGVGKSGIVAQKIAATFSSLGLPSFFLHPVEALHGDLGRVTKSDVFLLISKSGTTEELVKLLPFLSFPQERIVGFLGNLNSTLSQKCGVLFDCSVEKEACLNDLAPTTSTTTALAMGDALAVLYESIKGISKESFALNHPGGLLGKSLLLKVKELMIPADQCPSLAPTQTLQDAILLMTQKPVGVAAIIENGKLKGIIVEGDIRRAFAKDENAIKTKLEKMMNTKPISISSDELVLKALEVMEKGARPVHLLPVVKDEKFLGVIRLQDLMNVGFSTDPKSK
jgi:arabinose-5-phosphate isomerase